MDINPKFDAHAQAIKKQLPSLEVDTKERKKILDLLCKGDKTIAGDYNTYSEKKMLDQLHNAIENAKKFYENL